jgi:hypothetical protein
MGNEVFKVLEKNGLYIVPSNCNEKHEVANVTLTHTNCCKLPCQAEHHG